MRHLGASHEPPLPQFHCGAGAADLAALLGARGACACPCSLPAPMSTEIEEMNAQAASQGAIKGAIGALFGFSSDTDFANWARALPSSQLEGIAAYRRAILEGGA